MFGSGKLTRSIADEVSKVETEFIRNGRIITGAWVIFLAVMLIISARAATRLAAGAN